MAQVVVAALGGALLTYYFTGGNTYDSAAQVERDRSSLDDAVNNTVNRGGANSGDSHGDRRSTSAAAAALGEVVVKEIHTLVDYIVRDFVRSWYKLSPAVGGYISPDDEFLEHATYVLRHVIITFAARIAQLNPIEVLSDDVATACSYHMRWHSEMMWRASAVHPDLFHALQPDAIIARARERLGPAADVLPQEQLLEEERHMIDIERDRAVTQQYLRANVLHEVCHAGQGGMDGMASQGEEEVAKRAEWQYLRRLAAQLLPELLPECEQGSTSLSILLREILTTCVFQPSLAAVHPHALNGWLLTALRSQGQAGTAPARTVHQAEVGQADGSSTAVSSRPSMHAEVIDDHFSTPPLATAGSRTEAGQESTGLLAVLSPVFEKAVTRQVQTESNAGGGVASDLPPELERRLSQSEADEGAMSSLLPAAAPDSTAVESTEGADFEGGQADVGDGYSSDDDGDGEGEDGDARGSFAEESSVQKVEGTAAAEYFEPGDEYGGRHVESFSAVSAASSSSHREVEEAVASGTSTSVTRSSASLLKDAAWAICKSTPWMPLSSLSAGSGPGVLPALQGLRFNPLTMFNSSKAKGPGPGWKAEEVNQQPRSPGILGTPVGAAAVKSSENDIGAFVSVRVHKASVSFEKDGPAFDPKAVTRYALSIRMEVKEPQSDRVAPACTAYWKLRIRYSEFYDLHQAIKKYLPDFPGNDRFPPKVTFSLSSQFDEEFVEKRKVALDSWLQEVLAYPALRDCAEVRALLCPRDRSDIVLEEGAGRTGGKSSLKGVATGASASEGSQLPKKGDSAVRFADSELGGDVDSRRQGMSGRSGQQGGGKGPGGKAKKKVSPALEAAKKAQRQRERQAAAAVGRSTDVPGKQSAMLLTPTELAKLESRAFGLLTDVIDVQQHNWLHRHVLGALRHLVRLLYHGAAAETVAAAYKEATSARSAAGILRYLHAEVLWPGGKWGEALPSPTQADIIKAKQDLLQSLLSTLPPTAHSFIGKDTCDAGMIRLWSFLQCPVAIRSLLYTLLDLLLARAFPGIAVHGLSRTPPKVARLPTPGMYGFVEESKPQDNVAASVMAATVAFGSAAGAGASAVATGTLKTVGAVTGVVGGAVVSISTTAGRSLVALAGNTLASMGLRASHGADTGASPPGTSRSVSAHVSGKAGMTASPSLSSAYASTASLAEQSIGEVGPSSRRGSVLASSDGVHTETGKSPADSAASSRKASVDYALQLDGTVAPSSVHHVAPPASAWSTLRGMSPQALPSMSLSMPTITSRMHFPRFGAETASPGTPPVLSSKEGAGLVESSVPGQAAVTSSP